MPRTFDINMHSITWISTVRTSSHLVIVFPFFSISTQQINFDFELDPVKLLGDVQVVRSLAEKKKGPKFYVHAKRNPLEVEVNNYDISINHYVIYL